MTVYKLLEILSGVKNKDIPVVLTPYCVALDTEAAKSAFPFPDDLDPDSDEGEGCCFIIFGGEEPPNEKTPAAADIAAARRENAKSKKSK